METDLPVDFSELSHSKSTTEMGLSEVADVPTIDELEDVFSLLD